ncbi:PepP Xaa-Pro aminopeptidase [Pyrenophora tritici-repentis]|nr:PepP Xaa-Pro aminopeptidase [Pyrenophora tritici-repentis]KAI0576238.1 PepP Xaa-Pro aminopeptidase [Pyrenophora tritici-repentis]KAI0619046.1 PepP Xaa-Pro aminopeptidase [Pyrenophora tritici-repentis]
MASLLSIPLELLVAVSAYLPTEDLGSLRLTCKQTEKSLYEWFSKEFFTKKQFMLTYTSLQALVDISNHVSFSKKLAHVIIGVNVYEEMPLRFRDSSAAERYIQGYEDQQTLTSTGLDREMLTCAFERLENLTTVGIRNFDSASRVRDGKSWGSWGATTVYKETGIQLRAPSHNFTEAHQGGSNPFARTFSVMLYALGKARRQPPEFEVLLRQEGLPDIAFSLPDFIRPTVEPVLQHMTTLLLSLDFTTRNLHTHSNGMNADPNPGRLLRRFLRCTPNLTHLRLNFLKHQVTNNEKFLRWLGQPAPAAHLLDADFTDPPAVALSRLNVLELGLLSTNAQTLVDIITKFAPTLKDVSLWRMNLDESLRNRAATASPDHKPNFWRDLFIALSKIGPLELTHIKVGMLQQGHLFVNFRGGDDDTDVQKLKEHTGKDMKKFWTKQHARRVQAELGVEDGLIYLPGQPARNNEDSDMPAPFRQRRYFYYMSGCDEPDCHLMYDIRRDVLTLFIPRIKPERVIWNGRGSTPAEALAKYDIDQVHHSQDLAYIIQNWAFKHQNTGIYILHPSSRIPGCDNLMPRIDSHSLQPAMNLCRMIKDDHEIKRIRKANDISSQAHREVLANIQKYKNEAQVEGLFMDVCISRQAKQQAYDPIAASGPNAGTLHYDANNEDLAGRQLMCLDAGCEFELYASDITRTFPLSASWPSKEAENIYNLVQRMQETCIERLEPGVRYLDLHIMAHQVAIDGLLRLGILCNGTREEIYKAGTSRAFFPHGLGHHIGLEVHDVGQAELMSVRRGKPVYQQAPSLYPENFHDPVYDSETCHAPTDPQSSHLEEGMVVTVEPGIYFSVYALQHFYLPSPIHSKFINLEVLERYLPVGGVRIEDDILITANGHENLTTAPKGEAMLDMIRQGKPGTTDVLIPSPTYSRRMRSENNTPRLCAPGISKNTLRPLLTPLARAATLPTEFRQQDDFDFEPTVGPSLFSGFSRAMTTEEKIQQWKQKRDSVPVALNRPTKAKSLSPVCGENTPNVQHVYMSTASDLASFSQLSAGSGSTPVCKNCGILVQTLDRLRQNLSSSVQTSPKPMAMPTFEPIQKSPTSDQKHREMACTNSLLDKVPIGLSNCVVSPEERRRKAQSNRHHSRSKTTGEAKSRFSIRYTPTGMSPLVPSHDPHSMTRRSSPERMQPVTHAPIVPPRHLTYTTTTPQSPAEDRVISALALPRKYAEITAMEASQQAGQEKLDTQRTNLDAVQDEGRKLVIRSRHRLIPQSSMPVLMSQNPYHHHSTRSHAREVSNASNKRSIIDSQPTERRTRPERPARDYVPGDEFFTR